MMARAYYLAPSLATLRTEINRRWPARSKRSDGWIGDAAHAARASDHNPNRRGSVNALDVTRQGIDTDALLAATIRDPRTNYIIFDRVIYSRSRGFTPRTYTGSNPHTAHMHISILQTRAAEQDTRPWGIHPATTPGPPATGVTTPTAPDTRTDLERLLHTMDERTLGDLIYSKVAEVMRDDGDRQIGRAQQGAWQALGSAPITGRDDEWGASLRDNIARASYRAGVAVTLLSQVLTALSTISRVDTTKLAAELAPLIPGVQPTMTVEQIAAEVRREIGEALTES